MAAIRRQTTQKAIATMSCLAECYADAMPWVTAQAIAESRNLSFTSITKILTLLVQRGLVNSSTGKGGGYRLARPPSSISLLEIVRLFECTEQSDLCPFGPDWCASNCPCPLHDARYEIIQMFQNYLSETTLAVFEAGR